jgi:hypothetical protein
MVTSDQLIGTWKVIEDPFNRSEETFYSFTPTVVTIAFETKNRTQKIFLTYELEGNIIITDQPSHPKIERSKIKVEGDILTLDYNGQITRLKRSPEPRRGTLKTIASPPQPFSPAVLPFPHTAISRLCNSEKPKTQTSCELLLNDDELLLMCDMVGNSFSGAPDWVVPEQEYQDKFGIPFDRTAQLFNFIRSRWKERRCAEAIVLKKEEVSSIIKIIEYMLQKWDEGDFSTLADAQKRDAVQLLQELRQIT